MNRSKITYQGATNAPVTVEIGTNAVKREDGCNDIALARSLGIDCPLTICCLIRTDGSAIEWYTEWSWQTGYNPYWHFPNGSGCSNKKPTRSQQETIARIWFGDVKPFGVRGTCGIPVMEWLGLSMDEVSEIVGRRIALA